MFIIKSFYRLLTFVIPLRQSRICLVFVVLDTESLVRLHPCFWCTCVSTPVFLVSYIYTPRVLGYALATFPALLYYFLRFLHFVTLFAISAPVSILNFCIFRHSG